MPAKKKRNNSRQTSCNPPSMNVDDFSPNTPEEQQFIDKIYQLLHNYFDVDFTHYRNTTIQRRLFRRLTICKQNSYAEYYKYLTDNENEVQLLYNDLLLYFTKFFRDPHIFEMLKDKVFSNFTKNHSAKKPVRIWVAGCSTGEEVYSIAISLYEYLEETKQKIPVQIFGTDLVEAHIAKARTGLYSDKIREDVSPSRLERFFDHTSGGFKVIKYIREMCVFAVQNITQDPPFLNIDLVSCRNVLIYFDAEFQDTVIPCFHFALNSEGFLLLGTSETMSRFPQYFNSIDHTVNLFKKRSMSERPIYRFSTQHFPHKRKMTSGKVIEPFAQKDKKDTNKINNILFDTFVPPGVLVDNNMQINEFIGNTSKFLSPVSGEASFKLSRMVNHKLMPDLYMIIEEAKKKQTRIKKKNVIYQNNNVSVTADISVIPTKDPINNENNYLILFEESETPIIVKHHDKQPDKPDNELQNIKQELRLTKEHLQSIIEEKNDVNQELWAANEEVSSTNEELQSVNEEMEAAKEELESSNEELISLNEELQKTNVELIESKEFAENLIETANTVIITLDNNAIIKTFNSYAEKITGYHKEEVIGKNWFNLFIPAEEKHKIQNVFNDILQDKSATSTFENLIVTKSGEKRMLSWSNNTLKYASNIIGVISIGIDITERVKAENEVQNSEIRFRSLFNNMSIGCSLWHKKNNKFILSDYNTTAEKMDSLNKNDIIGKSIDEIFPDPETKLHVNDMFERIRVTGKSEFIQATEYMIKENSVWRENFVYRVSDNEVAVLFTDVTERKIIEDALQISEQKYRRLTENAKDMIYRMSLPDGKYEFLNEATEKIIGYTPQECYNGVDIRNTIHPDWQEYLKTEWDNLLDGNMAPFYEYQIIHKSGEIKWLNQRNVLIKNENGKSIAIEGIVSDVTERKKTELQLKESVSFLDTVINNSPFGMWISDKNGTIIKANKSIYRMANIREDQFVGIYNIFKDDNVIKMGLLPQIESVFENHTIEFFNLFWKASDGISEGFKNGNNIYIDAVMFPILNNAGELTNVVCQWTDVTKRTIAEKSLQNSEEKYRTLVSSMSDIIFVLDKNDCFVDVHYNEHSALLIAPEQFIGKKHKDVMPPDSHQIFKETVHKVRKTGETQRYEYSLQIDKKVMWFSATLDLHKDGQQIIAGIREISEEKQAKAILKDKLTELKRFNNIMVGRELKMIDLKKEINQLCKKLNIDEKYRIPKDSE